jgi:hypothetical protein
MGKRQAHLNDVINHLSSYLHLHNRKLREELKYDQQKERTDLQDPLYRQLHSRISYYAINQVENHRRFYNLTRSTAGNSLLPCK